MNAEKAYDKIRPFMIRTFWKLEIGENLLRLIKDIYGKDESTSDPLK